jgi:hypothetical protein
MEARKMKDGADLGRTVSALIWEWDPISARVAYAGVQVPMELRSNYDPSLPDEYDFLVAEILRDVETTKGRHLRVIIENACRDFGFEPACADYDAIDTLNALVAGCE